MREKTLFKSHVGTVAAFTLALSNYSLAQIDPSFKDQASSAIQHTQSDSTSKEIPVWLSGRIGNIVKGMSLEDLRIEGEFAKYLYSKRVFLVFLFKSPTGEETGEHHFDGNGAIFYSSADGSVLNKEFRIQSFSCTYGFDARSGHHDVKSCSESFLDLKDALFRAVYKAAAPIKVQSTESLRNHSDGYYETFKELIKTRPISVDSPSSNFFGGIEFQRELDRFDQLSALDVPEWLTPIRDELGREFEAVLFLKDAPLDDYAILADQHSNPDDGLEESSPITKNREEALSSIRKGLNKDLQKLRGLASTLESHLNALANQEREFQTRSKLIGEFIRENSIVKTFKDSLTTGLIALSEAQKEPSSVFNDVASKLPSSSEELELLIRRYEIVEQAQQDSERLANPKTFGLANKEARQSANLKSYMTAELASELDISLRAIQDEIRSDEGTFAEAVKRFETIKSVLESKATVFHKQAKEMQDQIDRRREFDQQVSALLPGTFGLLGAMLVIYGIVRNVDKFIKVLAVGFWGIVDTPSKHGGTPTYINSESDTLQRAADAERSKPNEGSFH